MYTIYIKNLSLFFSYENVMVKSIVRANNMTIYTYNFIRHISLNEHARTS